MSQRRKNARLFREARARSRTDGVGFNRALDELRADLTERKRRLIVCFCGWKGSTGKTTLSINVAAEFRRRGRRVLVVDADYQWRAISRFYQKARSAGRDVPEILPLNPTASIRGTFQRRLDGFEVVVIDCPDGDDDFAKAALLRSNVALLPALATPIFESPAMDWTVSMVKAATTMNPELRAAILLSQRFNHGRSADEETWLRSFDVPVMETEILNSDEIVDAGFKLLDVGTYAPASYAAEQVRLLVDEIGALRRPLSRLGAMQHARAQFVAGGRANRAGRDAAKWDSEDE